MPFRDWHRTGFLMTGCLCFLLTCCVTARAQKPTGSLHLILHNTPAKEALHQIERQAGVTFHFDKTRIDLTKTVTLDFEKSQPRPGT